MEHNESTGHHRLSPIESCPNEILYQIEKRLSSYSYERLAEILALRSTSQRLNAVFTQFAVKDVSYTWKIEKITTEEGVVGEVERQSRQASPAPNVFIPFISSIRIDFQISNADQAIDNPHAVSDLLEPLWDELRSYHSLDSIEVAWRYYSWYGTANCALYEVLANKLLEVLYYSTNQQFTQFSWIVSYDLHAYKPFHQFLPPFVNLTKLHLEVGEAGYSLEEIKSPPSLVGDLLIRFPGLRSLSLSLDHEDPPCALEELFPMQLGETGLETVEIAGTFPEKLPGDLSVTPQGLGFNLPSIVLLQNLVIRSRHIRSVNLDRLWHTLKVSNVRLTKISLDYGISDTLMTYLSSYEGLSELALGIYVPYDVTEPLVLPSFIGAIQKRAPSLTSLHIQRSADQFVNDEQPRWEGMSLDTTTWPTASSFRRLTVLHVCAPRSWKLDQAHCQLLLDYVVDIPRLVDVDMEWHLTDFTTNKFHRHLRRIEKQVFVRRCKLEVFKLWGKMLFFEWYAEWTVLFPPAEGSGEGAQFPLGQFRCSREFVEDDSSD